MTRAVTLGVPTWFAGVPFAVPPLLWEFGHRRRYHRRQRLSRGLCPACGYDLRASPGQCPECGAVQ